MSRSAKVRMSQGRPSCFKDGEARLENGVVVRQSYVTGSCIYQCLDRWMVNFYALSIQCCLVCRLERELLMWKNLFCSWPIKLREFPSVVLNILQGSCRGHPPLALPNRQFSKSLLATIGRALGWSAARAAPRAYFGPIGLLG